jgi:hypothetical protein
VVQAGWRRDPCIRPNPARQSVPVIGRAGGDLRRRRTQGVHPRYRQEHWPSIFDRKARTGAQHGTAVPNPPPARSPGSAGPGQGLGTTDRAWLSTVTSASGRDCSGRRGSCRRWKRSAAPGRRVEPLVGNARNRQPGLQRTLSTTAPAPTRQMCDSAGRRRDVGARERRRSGADRQHVHLHRRERDVGRERRQ